MTTNDQVQKYYDALIASYDILSEAITTASERGLRISSQFMSDVATGQREALELGKKVAAEPADMSKLYAAILEATTSVQSRTLQFAQTAYQEAIGAGSEAKATLDKLVEANKATAQAALDFASKLGASNPLAEQWKKGLESMMPQTAKTAARKTPAGV